jgi:ABC-type multidrug transport system permease subunit
MKVWRDREGRWITLQEFMTRFKQGVLSISQLQQAKSIYNFTWLIIIGVLIGVVLTTISKLWWLDLILIGSLLVTAVTQVVNYQKLKSLQSIYNDYKAIHINETNILMLIQFLDF